MRNINTNKIHLFRMVSMIAAVFVVFAVSTTIAHGAAYTLVASPTTVASGSLITLNWSAPISRSGHTADWVALYQVGNPDTNYTTWSNTAGATSGTFTTNAPATAGLYEFRYLLDNGYVDVARSNVIVVTGSVVPPVTTYIINTSSSSGGTTSGGGTFNSGSAVTVVASPYSNYTFVNWTEGSVSVSSSLSYTFTANANRNLVANFVYSTANLNVSCSAGQIVVSTGDSVNWVANVSGGNGYYTYSWSGDEGLSGYGSSVYKNYYNTGNKFASVTVTSGSQTLTRACNNSVSVSSSYYNNNQNYYNYNNNYYLPLQVSCSSDKGFTLVPYGTSVYWSAVVSGGNGVYNYSWSGSDGLYGYSQGVNYAYNSQGLKNASVVVSSGGQTATAYCVNPVNVGYQNTYQNTYTTYQNPIYPQVYSIANPNISSNNFNGLDVTCSVEPESVATDQPATWDSEVTGGVAPYTYSWTGTDGLSGNQASVTKFYSTTGDKSAVVSVTSSDGKTGIRACANELTVHPVGGVYYRPAPIIQTIVQPAATQPPVQPTQNSNPLSASALFSLSNISWGWIAVLIILILFSMVMYLLFTRPRV